MHITHPILPTGLPSVLIARGPQPGGLTAEGHRQAEKKEENLCLARCGTLQLSTSHHSISGFHSFDSYLFNIVISQKRSRKHVV